MAFSVDAKTSFDKQHVPCGLVVRISGFHPDGPGSIPGTGIPGTFFYIFLAIASIVYNIFAA